MHFTGLAVAYAVALLGVVSRAAGVADGDIVSVRRSLVVCMWTERLTVESLGHLPYCSQGFRLYSPCYWNGWSSGLDNRPLAQ